LFNATGHRSLAFKTQRDLYFFPENQNFKNKMLRCPSLLGVVLETTKVIRKALDVCQLIAVGRVWGSK
jgi:hypothetical protein